MAHSFTELDKAVVCVIRLASCVSLILREMQIKTATSYCSEWPSLKSLKIINSGDGVEKREPSYTVGRNVNWYSHYEKQ